MSFTCPECGAVSHHPDDERNGYCGRCNAFTEELHSWLRCLAIELKTGTISREVYENDRAFYRTAFGMRDEDPADSERRSR